MKESMAELTHLTHTKTYMGRYLKLGGAVLTTISYTTFPGE
jgi:hypothetical protein